mmetsp:Transcript_25329/g.69823  ORF Transcript_25329/g.69823 Transcript_25329/m.69823 type:complete len:233 (-) Transcript_25329:2151-2849(-)
MLSVESKKRDSNSITTYEPNNQSLCPHIQHLQPREVIRCNFQNLERHTRLYSFQHTMALRDYMQDLIRAQNASEVNIVHDVSMSTLPYRIGECNGMDGFDLNSSMSSLALEDLQEFNRKDNTGSLHYLSAEIHADSCSDEVPVTENRSQGFLSACEGGHGDELGLMLEEFRERHRRLKQTLSPVKMYKLSPREAVSQSTPTKYETKRGNQRSRLAFLATASEISGLPSLIDV